MPFLELYDETLDINSTENYELSVQVSSDDISFCILDTLRNKFVMLRSYEPEDNSRFDPYRLNEIIRKDDFLIRKFRKTNIITPTPRSTMVPGPLFEDSRKEEYLDFNQKKNDRERVMISKIKNSDIYTIFSLQEGFADLLKGLFPEGNIMHSRQPLFQYVHFNRRSTGNNVHIHFEKEYFDTVIFDPNELKFCNTFNFKSRSDIEYFVLYVLKKMNVRQDETVYLSGKTQEKEALLHGFSQYLTDVRFALPQGNYTFSYVLSETELHRFLLLFSAVNCE
ncbi:MAG: DUF3822 family protein [Bacteroidales bacterium]|nr:DUF3822 family protein [Bacteroidales bacterium]